MSQSHEESPLLLAARWEGNLTPASFGPPAADAATPQKLPLPAEGSSATPVGYQGETPIQGACDLEAAPLCPHCKGASATPQRSASGTPSRALMVDGSPARAHPSGCPWGMTGTLLLADMLGLGALAIPAVFANCGWLLACAAIAIFSLGCGFIGVIFTRLAVAVPDATNFDTVAEVAMGRLGKALTFLCFNVTIIADPIVLQLTCVLALRQVFPSLSALAAGLIIMGIMIPFAQIRNVHDIGSLASVATGCMALAIIVCLCKLIALPGSAFEETSLLPPADATFSSVVVALMNAVFAFGGQVNWFRYISAMHHRDEFKYAAELADAFMSCFYVLLGVVAYWKLGSSFDTSQPITSVLPRDGWTVLMNAALLVRCIVAFTLNINVYTDMGTRLARPLLDRLPPLVGEAAAPRVGWAAVSLAGLALSFLVAFAVPFFSTMLSFIAVFGDVLAPYALPALFGLILLKDLPRWERAVLKALVPISILFAGAGLIATCLDLASRL